MWSNLSLDLLAVIFSFLPVDSLANASSACRNWYKCSKAYPLSTTQSNHQPPWFLAFPIQFDIEKPSCFALNPVTNNWHQLSLEFFRTLPGSILPVAPIGTLLLFEVTNFTTKELQLGLCNPFTRQFRFLPRLHNSRIFSAVGVTFLEDHASSQFPRFRAYVAGGISEAARGFVTTVEMYDSKDDKWEIVGLVPAKFAFRLTKCNKTASVFFKGTVYWITSPMVYHVMGFDVIANTWREVAVPVAEGLESATLVKRNGALALVGATSGGSACVWEMNEGGQWCLVDEVPGELGLKLMSGKRHWNGVSVGDEEAFCLYTDLGYGMLVCKKVEGDEGRWEWVWVDGSDSVKGIKLPNLEIKGALLHPTIASFLI